MSEDRSPADRLPGTEVIDVSQRQLTELMNEVRIVMPGVQVLFAFLLAVPFQSGFDSVSDTERVIYLVTLLSAGLASACLVACAALHRVLFGQDQRDFIIRTGNRLAVAALIALATAMSCAGALVVSYLWSPLAGWLALAGGAVLFGSLWFVLPLAKLARSQGS